MIDTQESLGPFAAFRYRDYRLFWINLFLSNIGTWMQITAVSWLLFKLTGSPLKLGINGLFRAIPIIGFGIISGTIVDRFDRKKLLLLTQCLLGIMAFVLGTLDHTGIIQPWHIYLVTFLSASVESCDGPARQGLFPSLIPRTILPNAVALNSILWRGAALIGPTLGGFAISLLGTSGAFYVNAISYFFVVVALLLMHIPAMTREKARSFLIDLKAGLTYVHSQKVILGIIAMEATTSLLGLDNAMLTIFAGNILKVGAHGFGMLQSARGLGAILGSSLFIAIGQRPFQGKIIIISALLYSLSFILFGLSHSFTFSLILLSLIGAADTIWSAVRNTILQWETPEGFRGRVMGIFQLAGRGLNPLGQVETGIVVPFIGARNAVIFGGLTLWLVTSLTTWRIPDISRFTLMKNTQGENSTEVGDRKA